ncbi:MAG: hypothetical protein ACYTG0_24765 [Planctomycetota bacterium]|jgi:hypothetical protein
MRVLPLLAAAVAASLLTSTDVVAQPIELDNVARQDDRYVLAAGPNVEGVVLLRQGRWPPEAVEAFHRVGWIDAASIRVRWAELEPKDEQYDWSAFDRVLAEVKRYNQNHPGSQRTLHVRVMGGVHCPKCLEAAGVRFYDTLDPVGAGRRRKPIRVPVPYDNPEFLKQLRQVYRAMYERYHEELLVTVYHGTWSAGPWDEIFHPQDHAPLPPGYTPAKFVEGMIGQLDVLIDEFCINGKVAELPYSGKYPPKSTIDVTGPLNDRIVERLGRRSPFLYIQSNGWGMTNRGVQTVSWGHEPDIEDTRGRVNLALQALGTNAGGGWLPQGDWVGLVEIAKRFDVAYVELYPPDFTPLDARHRIVEAFTQGDEAGGVTTDGAIPGFVGFRRWLADRRRVLYVREGTIRQVFPLKGHERRIDRANVDATVPADTRIDARVRTREAGSPWSDWLDVSRASQSPPGSEAQVEVLLHTDDGYRTPEVRSIQVTFCKATLP